MMDILKRIDFVQQFANEYADGSWSVDVDKWRNHVTPEFIEDIRQYIVSLQLKLMHEQTVQAKPYTYLWEADGTCQAVKGDIQISSNTGPAYGWKVTPLYTAPIPQQPAQPVFPFVPWSKEKEMVESWTAQQAQPERAPTDVQRYQWLRQRIEVKQVTPATGPARQGIDVKIGCAFLDSKLPYVVPASYPEEQAQQLDAAIDAAIKQGGQHD